MTLPLPQQLWPWEEKTIPPDNYHATGLPLSATFWSLLGIALLLTWLTEPHAVFVWLAIPVIARLAALDLCLRVLPHIYTGTLLLIGIIIHPLVALMGLALAGALLLFTWGLARLFQPGQPVCGGGDVVLILALGAWLGPFSLPLALLLAGILHAVALLILRTRPLPFGPALLISLLVFIWL